MQGEGLGTLELALGVAAALLGARLWAFRKAEAALPGILERIRLAAATGDGRAIRTGLRRLAGQVPFGDWAGDWLRGLDEPTRSVRSEALERAQRSAVRRVVRRAARGQALDLTALAVLAGLGTFANSALPAGPVFWGLGGLLVLLLIGSVILRGSLGHSVRSTLETLRGTLSETEVVTDAADGCERCGGTLSTGTVFFRDGAGEREMTAHVCGTCGTWTGVLPPGTSETAEREISRAQ